MYKPKILIDVNAEQMYRQKEREREERERHRLRELEKEREREREEQLEAERRLAEREMEIQDKLNECEERSDDGSEHHNEADHTDERRKSPGSGTGKKKLDVKEVFNNDDDDEDGNLGSGKKRKLVPLGLYFIVP